MNNIRTKNQAADALLEIALLGLKVTIEADSRTVSIVADKHGWEKEGIAPIHASDTTLCRAVRSVYAQTRERFPA